MADNAGKEWSVFNDGVWRQVAFRAGGKVLERAEFFVKQLQESVRPTDMLQSLLLDRIATGWIRRQVLLEVQGAAALRDAGKPGRDNVDWFANLLKYEAVLDRTFHRDLFLLQQLQEASSFAPALSVKKLPKSERGLIGDQANSNAADQAVGSPAVITQVSSVAPGSEVEQSGQERRDFGSIELE